MTAAPSPADPDRETLRRASLKVALRISAGVAILVLVLLAAATVFLMNKLAHPSVPSSPAYTYLDSRDLIEGMILAGLAGIVLAGVVGWVSARSAIRPLGEALARQRRFVQDASHELRTPLAILDTRIQLAQRKAEPGSESAQALARIREDTATLTGIVNELLLAATASAPSAGAEPADAASAARSVSESLQDLARQQGVSVEFSSGGQALVRVDPGSMRRAVLALADNALAHTPSGGRVAISCSVEGSRAVILVADTGSGITGVDPGRIFDRFVRAPGLDGDGGRRSFGIGLALVRDIATAAGGTVEVARTGPGGTTMRLALPLALPLAPD
ncbi:HAMP domain-containing sensor histidine kinase [Pseudarthrobacter sp. NIBRBAC000502771]|uniref:sensor histidine kinase n=1 Tax=Pseudarthrobacter sp. NIBRBAC000502771 TaxID=2590774 RepID=UPI0011313E55|nr:HAMP domain-containing sensor histidine kinase [Pseudarthrobacter sp. NIBRBAC000502771]QDG62539.1 HAMP domain-containing histidine kinase [Pseudarthrobacter sp. NIBRBAC000502771]